MPELTGDITNLRHWGFKKGLWWEVGSGVWKQEGTALRCEPGRDPEWTWITSPDAFPSEFELTLVISGKAELAGIGFGVAKDFLAPLASQSEPVTLDFVMRKRSTGFRLNGRPYAPTSEFQFNIAGVESLRSGRLQLKAFKQKGPVLFDAIYLTNISRRR